MKRKECVVIGLGRFGTSVAENLAATGNDVLAIDINEDAVRHILDKVAHAVQADIQDEEVVERLGLNGFDVGIVAIGEDVESSCMAIIALKKQGVKYIIAKAKSPTSGKILEAVGADKVIYPERDMGVRVAHNIFSPNILDFFEFSDNYSFMEVIAPEWTIDKSIIDLHIRKHHHINIVAIKNNGKINPDIQSNTIIKENDILIVMGKNEDIYQFSSQK